VKILITDGISREGTRLLTDAGHEICENKLSPGELLAKIGSYDCIIVRSATTVTKEVIDAGKNLKIIARGGVGVDNIDVKYAESKNIKVLNTSGASAISVAELAIAHMMALSRYLHVSTTEIRKGKWPKKEYSHGIELYEKYLGIIGLGNIGKEVARRALGLGMHVLAYDPPLTPMDFMVEITTKEKVLAKSDFISLHVPLDKSGPTIGKKELDQMKKGVVLINCSRGGVIDEQALLDALKSGKVGGAALDVFVKEPPMDAQKELLNHPRVSVSPHIGGSTVEAQERVGVEIALKVNKFFNPERAKEV
jgi:D-3-phosphoglycerate dehydrogenase